MCPEDNLVVDVRDVHDVENVVSKVVHQNSADNVEREVITRVADVRRVVYGGAAYVPLDQPGIDGHKRLRLLRQRIEQLKATRGAVGIGTNESWSRNTHWRRVGCRTLHAWRRHASPDSSSKGYCCCCCLLTAVKAAATVDHECSGRTRAARSVSICIPPSPARRMSSVLTARMEAHTSVTVQCEVDPRPSLGVDLTPEVRIKHRTVTDSSCNRQSPSFAAWKVGTEDARLGGPARGSARSTGANSSDE